MAKEKRHISLRRRIILSTLIPVVFCFVLIYSITFTSLFGLLHETAKAEFNQIGQKYAINFENKINYATNYLSIMSSMLEQRLETGATDRVELQKAVFRIFDDYGLIDGSSVYFEPNMFDGKDAEYKGTDYGTVTSGRICYYFYKDGSATAYLPEAFSDDYEFELPHYTDAKNANKPIYTNPEAYEVDGREISMFTITCPINNKEGEFIGAVTVDLFLKEIYEQLMEETIYKSGYIIIANGRDQVIYSPFFENIGKTRRESGLEYDLPPGGEVSVSFNAKSIINGKDTLVTIDSIYIPWLDSFFYISVAAPLSEINDAGMRLMVILIMLSILAIAIIAALLYYLVSKVSAPIRNMIESANKIAEGSTEYVSFSIKDTKALTATNEIYTLSTVLKKMLAQIHEGQKSRLEALEMKHKKENAEARAQAKNDFLAKMSHEIRTPMNAVIGMSELILRKDIPPDVYEDALVIKAAGANLLSIINDILDFSKIESGKLEIIETEYTFSSLINDVVNIIRIRLVDKPVLMAVCVDPKLPSVLCGDEVRIRQVLINILSNAVKYTEEGYIKVSVGCETESETVHLTVTVEDSGIGIKPEDLDKLFGDFVQVDAVNNRGIEGTGLGLVITRNLCRMMGGDITVRSEYGSGSIFTITLPQKAVGDVPFATIDGQKTVLLYETREIYAESVVAALDSLGVVYKSVESITALFEELENYEFAFISSFMLGSVKPALSKLEKPPQLVLMSDITDAEAPRSARILYMPAHSQSIANILNGTDEGFGQTQTAGASFTAQDAKVLIVDDVAANLRVAEGLLLPYEMQLTLCSSGREAIKRIMHEEFDLVFMDHMMPEMDGIEATRQIRELDGEFYKNLPIVALTANAVTGVREMFIQNGMNDFLAKPIETSKLNAVLEKWIPREKRKKNTVPVPPEGTNEFVESLRTVPELSVDKALEVVGGSAQTYERIVRLSVKLLPDNIERLCRLIENDLPNYSIEVHGVKGVLNNIGAYGIGQTALRLEEYSKNDDIESCRRLHPELIEMLKMLTVNVSSLVKDSEPSEKPIGENSQLLDALPKLLEEIDFYDSVAALAVLQPFDEYSFGQEPDRIIAELKSALEQFDFDAAQEHTEELTNTLNLLFPQEK